jgi:hypothetical protein
MVHISFQIGYGSKWTNFFCEFNNKFNHGSKNMLTTIYHVKFYKDIQNVFFFGEENGFFLLVAHHLNIKVIT